MSRGTKKSAEARRTTHAPRGAVRNGALAAKMAGSRKGAGEGVLPGMPNKKTTQRQGFKTNEFIVYPAHGVGIKRTMWSRRAQEYEAKINSGDIVAIAEVVRDLYRSETQPEQSYSERQLYEAALDRLSREIAAVQKITETEAVKEIEGALAKGPRRGPKPADEAEAEPATEEEAA